MKTLQAIRTKQEFQNIFENGKVFRGKFLKIWIRQEAGRPSPKTLKIAVIVSRKTAARAVDRNTWRRRIRETVRKKYALQYQGTAMIVQVRKSGPPATSEEIERELESTLRQPPVRGTESKGEEK